MRIGRRMLLGFGAILVATLAVGSVAVRGAEELRSLNDYLYQHPFAVTNATLEGHDAVVKMREHMLLVASSTNADERATGLDAVARLEWAAYDQLGVARSRFLGDKVLIDEVLVAMDAWRPVRERVAALAGQGRRDEAIALARGEGGALYHVVDDRIQGVMDFARAKAKSLHQQVEDAATTLAGLTLALVAAAGLIGAAVATATTRGLVGPLDRLRRTMGALAGGDTGATVDFLDRRDEIGEMAAAIHVFKDHIIQRQQAERALILARDEALSASQAKTAFLANMSHELRTPLNAILGFSEFLSSGYAGALTGIQAEYLVDIHASGRHLLALINDVLDIARIEAGREQLLEDTVVLGDCVDDMVDMIRCRAQAKRITVETDIRAGLPPLRADRVKVAQMILNLLSNAVKFTPEGGFVRVLAEQLRDGDVVLTVFDSGIGMRPDDIPLALETFRQVDGSMARLHEGTGLGLPLTRGLIELHGGSLEILSAPGEGTAASVWFPAWRAAAVEAVAS